MRIVTVARKPPEGTTTETVVVHGVGALNIEDTRFGPGRWPNNVVLVGSTVVEDLDHQSGERPPGYREHPSKTSEAGRLAYGRFEDGHERGERGYSDTGTAARFFKSF